MKRELCAKKKKNLFLTQVKELPSCGVKRRAWVTPCDSWSRLESIWSSAKGSWCVEQPANRDLFIRRLPSPLTSPASLQWVWWRGLQQRRWQGLRRCLITSPLKPGLWLQPDVVPVSTWPCCGPSLAADDCLAFPALSCHRPSHQAGMSSGSGISLCRGSFASGLLAAAPARMFCNEPGEASIPGRSGSGRCLPAGVWVRGQPLPAGLGWDSPFLRPCGTLASKLFICLSACPSGLEGLACSLQFPKGLPTAGQLEPSFALFHLGMFLNMTQKRLQIEKVRLLPATLPLPRILGPRSKLPQVPFVVCCLVFCLQTEVAAPTPEESCYVRCLGLCSPKGHMTVCTGLQQGSSSAMWIPHIGLSVFALEEHAGGARLSTFLRASPFSGLTCSSYFLM